MVFLFFLFFFVSVNCSIQKENNDSQIVIENRTISKRQIINMPDKSIIMPGTEELKAGLEMLKKAGLDKQTKEKIKRQATTATATPTTTITTTSSTTTTKSTTTTTSTTTTRATTTITTTSPKTITVIITTSPTTKKINDCSSPENRVCNILQGTFNGATFHG